GETGGKPGQPASVRGSRLRPATAEEEPGVTTLDEASIHVHLHSIGVHTVLCVFFALLTAGSNACAAVLQRKAAAQVPPERSMHVSLVADLVHRRGWLGGIRVGGVAVGAPRA